jgi:multiple sugar transport system permease protein
MFVSPALLGLTVFLVFPILLAFYVSMLKWNGQSNPLKGGGTFVGLENYRALLTQDKLTRLDFATSIRNNVYFVLGVVPLQTALALFLAVLVNQRYLKGTSFFRTAFYFPSVTSSIAISLVFLFLFQNGGAVNGVLRIFGVKGPPWFSDSRGLTHVMLSAVGVDKPPSALQHTFLSLSWWEWLSGPSIAMCTIMILCIWTTAGTFMLMFLAGLQNISDEVEEAAIIDGTTPWQRFWHVTFPMLRPILFLVLTLGIIGTWQVFDQVYVMSQGKPAKTTLTPAYLSYHSGFNDGKFGVAAAMAVLLFMIIVVFTVIQKWILRDRDRQQ